MKTFLSKFIKHLINLLDVCNRRVECIILIESAIEELICKYFNNEYRAKCIIISTTSMMSIKESKDIESIKTEFEDLLYDLLYEYFISRNMSANRATRLARYLNKYLSSDIKVLADRLSKIL